MIVEYSLENGILMEYSFYRKPRNVVLCTVVANIRHALDSDSLGLDWSRESERHACELRNLRKRGGYIRARMN